MWVIFSSLVSPELIPNISLVLGILVVLAEVIILQTVILIRSYGRFLKHDQVTLTENLYLNRSPQGSMIVSLFAIVV